MRFNQIATRLKNEDGQAIVIAVVAMSIFLIGAVGLGIDGAHLYAQRQLAQAAADSAAIAGITSIYNGTNGGFTPGTAFSCTTSDTRSPCKYAAANGFGALGTDTVSIDFPGSVAGVTLSPKYPYNVVRATVSRNVSTTLMRMLGPSAATITTTATAAIIYNYAPIPILIAHPTLSGSLSTNGGVTVTICGGPSRSIQVDSNSATSISIKGNSNAFDLSKAGPNDDGHCTTGTGADFGNAGKQLLSSMSSFNYTGGTTGQYIPSDGYVADPLLSVTAPPIPAVAGTKSATFNAGTTYNGITCPATASKACTLLTPGLYASGLSLKNTTALFLPGIYYVSTGGFSCASNCDAMMAPGAPADTITGTNWDGTLSGGGMLVYMTGSGQFNLGSNGSVNLIGSKADSAYDNILFFEDPTAGANTGSQAHSLGGGGNMSLYGTIYLTNRLAKGSTSNTYQELDLQGNPGNSTLIQGEIIVDALTLSGNAGIQMNLNSNRIVLVSQIALVN
jgi:hypothetical protein